MNKARIALGLFALLLLVGAAAFTAVSTNGTHSARTVLPKKGGDPDAGAQKDTASVEKGPAALTAAQESSRSARIPQKTSRSS
jgi:hypothetical protein